MIDRTTKLRWRRHFRSRKKQVTGIGVAADEQIERHLFRRLARLGMVRRFVFSWLILVVLLISLLVMQIRNLGTYYQKTVPVAGGTVTEGIVGTFTNANPLYATGSVDAAVSQLLFSGLLKHDTNNRLVGNLAESWKVDDREVTYTVKLRPNIRWHDGKPLTSQDVLFTYQTIQNADAKSPLFTSWQKITVTAPDDQTVVFTLPSPLSAFPDSLTNGIVPRHLLADVPTSRLRSERFNTINPVGSGPFKWDRIEVTGTTPEERAEQIGLIPNNDYFGENPKLQRYIIRSFREDKRMIDAFVNRELTAMSGLDTTPDALADKKDAVIEHNIAINGQVLVFFKTSHDALNDAKVRRALVHAVNQQEITKGLGFPAIVSKSPFLPHHIGFDKGLLQQPTDKAQANKLLDESGWVRGADGTRKKGDNPLKFFLFAQTTSEYAFVTQKLQTQWREVGVDVQVILQEDADFKQTVTNHSYDALLYAVTLGGDPDVYPYWHSTQADIRSANRLNFSEYKSVQADKALEAGRSRSDPALRSVKYKPFLEAWRSDAPALVLYQPRYLYITRGPIYGFDAKSLNSATDRYTNVENWMIRLGKANK